MALIRFTITISDIVGAIIDYDQIKIYRSTAGIGGPYTELTDASTRINLQTVVQIYDFIDIVGLSTFYYKYSLYNSETETEGALSAEFQGTAIDGLYCTLDEIRDEGLIETEFPTATEDRINAKIEQASRAIERITNRFFEPRYMTISMSGRSSRGFLLGVPIIRIDTMTIDGETQDLDDFAIFNRHLTQRLTRPDDRFSAKIAYKDDEIELSSQGYQGGIQIRSQVRPFHRGRLNVICTGLFGFTELGTTDPAGETSAGSQIPINFGTIPQDIKQACMKLVFRDFELLANTDELSEWADSWRIEQIKTRDQMLKYTPLDKVGRSSNLTGDPDIDDLLASYVAPKSMVGVI